MRAYLSQDRTEEFEGVLEDSFDFTRTPDRTATSTLKENTEYQYDDVFGIISRRGTNAWSHSDHLYLRECIDEVQDNKWLLHAYDILGREL